MSKKTDMLMGQAENHDKVKDKKVDELIKHKEDIVKRKVEHETNIEKINGYIE